VHKELNVVKDNAGSVYTYNYIQTYEVSLLHNLTVKLCTILAEGNITLKFYDFFLSRK